MVTALEIGVTPLTPALGAVVENVDLRDRPSNAQISTLRSAFLDFGVLFFPGQDLSDAQMAAFITCFGEPFLQPYTQADTHHMLDVVSETNLAPTKSSTAVWHADSTFLPEPPMATALRAVRLPAVGGDTCWANMYAAYDALSEPLRRMLDGLTAVHSMTPTLQREPLLTETFADAARSYGAQSIHPVIRVHPETGRKALYVNECSTMRIVECAPEESSALLALLFNHVRSPRFGLRWRWAVNDLAFWDNRAVQHFAVPDYEGERIMQRMEIAGDRPAGP